MTDAPLLPRSPFVTGLAIVAICLGGFMFLSDIVSAASVRYLMNSTEYRAAMDQVRRYAPAMQSLIPDPVSMLADTLVSLFLSAALVGSSIGLLRRMGWARISFLCVVWVQLTYSTATAIRGILLARSVEAKTGFTQALGAPDIWVIAPVFTGFVVLIGLLVAGTVTWKLTRPHIRAEFGKAGA